MQHINRKDGPNGKTTQGLDLQPWPKQSVIAWHAQGRGGHEARTLIESVLKPKHLQPPPKGSQLNYIEDITTKWLGSKCYFVSIYRSDNPRAISPTFESKFARMEYVGNGKFALSFMRHTGKWVRLYERMSVDECMKAIRDDPWFMP
jgi:hypothetical protein